jgi:NDP-sugar pyrophosphorylase family protein
MIAVILAGGKGTRLKPFTMTIPKPLLPLGDMPILEVVIRQLASAGATRIILTLGHMAPFFTTLLGDGSRWGVSLEYVYEDSPLGTAAPLRQVTGLTEDFLVMNGDLLTTLDFADLMGQHKTRQAWGTIALSQRVVPIDYGVVESGPDGELVRYVEKPSLPYEVSMGINVLSPKALAFLPASGRFDMPDLMLAIRDAHKPVFCYRTSSYWQDIGRFDDYQRASEDFSKDQGRFLPEGRPAVG